MRSRISCTGLEFQNNLIRASPSPNQVLTHAARAAARSPRAARAKGCLVPPGSTRIVKPARLHFARTARSLTGRYMCERGDLSEFLVVKPA